MASILTKTSTIPDAKDPSKRYGRASMNMPKKIVVKVDKVCVKAVKFRLTKSFDWA